MASDSETNLNQAQENSALSVSAAMAYAKSALESVQVRIVGEVSEVSVKAGYKAAYFTIKDEHASLPCLMWNNRYHASGIELKVGQLVEITGRFSLYAAKGRMNFDVFSLVLAGEGNLRLQVANLARKLEREGLMDARRKRPIPSFPEKIGLVTSPRGAAVRDVLRTLRRRYPLAEVYFGGVPVEGKDAPSHLIAALDTVNAAGVDLILLVRGGGSFEDLMPFNDEKLARAIAASKAPVITGIGHEPDTSIADMVADLRASTPTGAAEAASTDRKQIKNLLEHSYQVCWSSLKKRIDLEDRKLANLENRPVFRDPMALFATELQTIDFALERLNRIFPQRMEDYTKLIQTYEHRLGRGLPLKIAQDKKDLASLTTRTSSLGIHMLERFQNEEKVAVSRLHDLSPLSVLGRGYAVAYDESRKIVKSIDQVSVGDPVRLAISDGELSCTVQEKRKIDTSVEALEERNG
ncbi:MAG: exodeoxyribonuclease VII large subunit [Eggerthellaceae bacterium]|jgi:exodeoxyribonuclease VII large subunit